MPDLRTFTRDASFVAGALAMAAALCRCASLEGLSGGGLLVDAADAPRATVRFCSGSPAFCADFEGSEDVRAGWNELRAFGGGEGGIGSDDAGEHHWFGSHVPPLASGVAGAAALIYTVRKAATSISFSFDLRVDACIKPTQAATLATIYPESSSYAITLNIDAVGQLVLAEQSVPADGGGETRGYALVGARPAGEWARFTIDVALSAVVRGQVRVRIDGAEAYSGPLALSPLLSSDGTVTINSGVSMVGPSGGCGVAVDNVVLDLVASR